MKPDKNIQLSVVRRPGFQTTTTGYEPRPYAFTIQVQTYLRELEHQAQQQQQQFDKSEGFCYHTSDPDPTSSRRSHARSSIRSATKVISLSGKSRSREYRPCSPSQRHSRSCRYESDSTSHDCGRDQEEVERRQEERLRRSFKRAQREFMETQSRIDRQTTTLSFYSNQRS